MTADVKNHSKLIYPIILGGVVLILYVTLFPFDFTLQGDDFFSVAQIRFDLTLVKLQTPVDVLRNILLFIPLGFGFTSLLQKQKIERKKLTLLAVVIIGFGLSLTVELLQVLLPGRDPSVSDLLTNSLGAFLGYAVAYRWGDRILGYFSSQVEKIKNLLSLRMLAGIFVGYVTLFLLLSMWLQSMTTLTNWDLGFPLMLGNERTGDRPWQGRISELTIFNRAFSEAEVAQLFSEKEAAILAENSIVAAYRFNTKTNYQDQAGFLPDLVWQESNSATQNEAGILLGPEHWLATTNPVTLLNQKMRESSQFTLDTVVASAGKAQTGPARIVSISGDPFQRNLTLGQENADLVVRLRTPVTGENGKNPELVIPDVFMDTRYHHLILTYNGFSFKIYIDGLDHLYRFELSSEITIFRYLLPVDNWRIRLNTTDNIVVYKLLYYGLIFIPLGFIGFLIFMVSRKN